MVQAASIADVEVRGSVDEPARVGPNAVIQLGAVLRDRVGEERAASVFAAAGLGSYLPRPPAEMVPEGAAKALFDALFANLDQTAATAIAREAGTRTADYVITHRIPAFVRLALRRLPAALSAPLLLRAISRHAWTFAGSGAVTVRSGSPQVIEIAHNRITMPGCVWHVAVFERLFRRLAARESSVTHPICCRDGGDRCRFEIAVRGASGT